MCIRELAIFTFTVGLALAVATPTLAQQDGGAQPTHDHSAHQAEEAMPMDHSAHQTDESKPDEHAAHRAAMQANRYSVISEQYPVPEVTLIDQTGSAVDLAGLLESEHPIALNFIFTTCTTICPVMTATFAQMRRELGPEGEALHLVSISIDPEYDRPGVLKEYAELYHAGPNWTFLTGDSGDIIRVLQSFKSYFGSKMNHQPVTLLKKPGEASWSRIEGLARGGDLAREVKERLLD